MRPYKRKKNLIRPGLQLKMTLVFLATSASMLAFMAYLCVFFLTDSSFASPSEAARMQEQVFPVLINAFAITMALLVPATLVVGILATFLVAGPLYRFEQFLKSIQRGENPPDCRLRSSDELQEFATLLNQVTRPLRMPEDIGDELEASEAAAEKTESDEEEQLSPAA